MVVAADTLDRGVEYIQRKLGVTMPFGGVHPTMGTHNHLAALGKACFLEIIARNPEGATPQHPRWFGLDDPHIFQALRERPRLISWVVNTCDINGLVDLAAYPCGTPTKVSRGNLTWLFSLPVDGRLAAGGLLPHIIEWQTGNHPAAGMHDLGLRFKSLTLHHENPAWLRKMLSSIKAENLVAVKTGSPALEAVIETAAGEFTLNSLEA